MWIFGLDIGIASVGSAVLMADAEGKPERIEYMGVNAFKKAENDKDGASTAKIRREARSARRVGRRHHHRMDRIKGLIQRQGVMSKEQQLAIYQQKDLSDIYQIRYEGLDRRLDQEEWVRLLIHLAQRRGFRSNRKTENKKSDEGKLLIATQSNCTLMVERGYRTIGEMLFLDEKFRENKRNKGEDYSNTFLRSQVEEEVKLLFQAQREQGSEIASQEMEVEYLEILLSQRDFSQGPASGPYASKEGQIKKMIGKCTFEPEEDRGAKATYTFERWNLLQKINHLGIRTSRGLYKLTDEQRQLVLEYCHKTKGVTYDQLRKLLSLQDEDLFNDLYYGEKEIKEAEKAKFQWLTAYHAMRTAFEKRKKGYFAGVSIEKRNAIGTALTYFKTDDQILEYLSDLDFTPEELDVALGLESFQKMGNLSVKAMEKMIPYLEQGMNYDKACEAAGYAFRGHEGGTRTKYLPKLPKDCYEVTSPVVRRAIVRCIKVVNGLIRQYGSPGMIRIEMAREMSRNFEERNKITKEQDKNQKERLEVVEQLKKLGRLYPKGRDIEKYRLWQEQDGWCLYTQKPIAIERLTETGYCEIDHIIPRSASWDNRYKNKVLVLTQANREKGNRLPLNYVKDPDAYINLVNTVIKSKEKRQRLLKTAITEEDTAEMTQRNLQDTRFVTKFMLNYMQDHLIFDEEYKGKQRVFAVNGSITSTMRGRWGIDPKMREDGDLHHAVDAVVVATITPGLVARITTYYQYHERKKERDIPEDLRRFPLPWPEFRDELVIRAMKDPVRALKEKHLLNYAHVDLEQVKPIFVSRMVEKKSTGQAHEATIRRLEEIEGKQMVVTRTPIQELKYDRKTDKIENYYYPESDPELYQLLLDKLRQVDEKVEKKKQGKTAFPEGFVLKPTPKLDKQRAEGKIVEPPHKVRKVKIYKAITDFVEMNREYGDATGVASNGDMIRIDLFKVEGDGYYMVPIYGHHAICKELPNKAVVANKEYEEWKEMKEEDFLFSVYPGTLLKIIAKKEKAFSLSFEKSTLPEKIKEKEFFVYYRSANASTGSIYVYLHDNSYQFEGLGIKTLVKIEKYHVDILGNCYPAPKEERKPL